MPEDKKRSAYIESLKILREKGLYTIPTLLKDQKAFNPFLCADDNLVKKSPDNRAVRCGNIWCFKK